MWYYVSFAWYLIVAVSGFSENIERTNFTKSVREKRYGTTHHPPLYTFPTPPPSTIPQQRIPPGTDFDPFPFCIPYSPYGSQNPLSYSEQNPPTPIPVPAPNIQDYLYRNEDDEDPCNPHFSEKPDFLLPGRRISEAKCMDYVWTLNRIGEIKQNEIECEINKRKQMGNYNAVPAAVGGRAAFPGEFPHMGAIGWLGVNGKWLFKCGCSLISSKFVLTAAHCSRASSLSTDLEDPIPKIVRLSHVYIDLATRCEKNLKDDIGIKEIIVHPNYKPPKKYYDIALMELEHEVGFSQMVQPACLWTNPHVDNLGPKATLTGWGVLEEGSQNGSPLLQAAVVDFIGKRQCESLLFNKRNRNWSGLQEHQICAGKLAGGVDACQGDSGGPLQVEINLKHLRTPYKMYYVVGVTAFGFGCARRNLPGMYTRVSSFADWIESIVWK